MKALLIIAMVCYTAIRALLAFKFEPTGPQLMQFILALLLTSFIAVSSLESPEYV